MIQWVLGLAESWVRGWMYNFLFGSILTAVGFGPVGPIAGSIAAWWQSLYGGFVPAGSLFAWLQRLGMVIGNLGPFAGMFGGWFFGWAGRLMPANPLFGTIWRFFMGGLFF